MILTSALVLAGNLFASLQLPQTSSAPVRSPAGGGQFTGVAPSPGRITLHGASGLPHQATGGAVLGPDVIYSSNCPVPYTGQYGYAYGFDQFSLLDVGRIPSPTSPDSPNLSKPGCATGYWINGFEFGYCTDQPALTETIHFYAQAHYCANPSTPGDYLRSCLLRARICFYTVAV